MCDSYDDNLNESGRPPGYFATLRADFLSHQVVGFFVSLPLGTDGEVWGLIQSHGGTP